MYFLEVDGPIPEPTPSSPSLIVIDDEKDDLDVLGDERNWELGDIVDESRTVNQETRAIIERLKTSCVDAKLPVPYTVLSIVDMSEQTFIATAAIEGHVLDEAYLVHKVVFFYHGSSHVCC